MTLTTLVQSNIVPTSQKGAPINSKNGPTRYNTQEITTVSNHMLCSNGDQSLPKKIEKLDFLHLFLCSTFPLISQKGTNWLKLDRRCQWGPAMLVQRSDGSLRAYLVFRLGTDTILAKTVFFLHFFHKLGKWVTPMNGTEAKGGPTCCPNSHCTATCPQLAVVGLGTIGLTVLAFFG